VEKIQRLMQAGLIAPTAALSPADQQIINSLSDDEISALISIKGKVGEEFLQRNLASRTIGIVF
jgi:hypothetical protein